MAKNSTIKQSTSGEDSHIDNRKLDDHLGEGFLTHDESKNKWEGQEVEVKSDPLVDSGTGKQVIIRMFQFAANPEILKKMKPTKQQLFDDHVNMIRSYLWMDGLIPVEGISPRVNTSKKREMYRIFVTCEARNGVVIAEKSKTLQELIKN